MSKSLTYFDTMDAFISYRRQGGGTVAALLYSELSQRGLRVFMDTKELTQGDYEEAILKNIKASKHFILLLSENVFQSKNVVWEVSKAIELIGTSNIIPVFINNHNKPTFPTELQALEKINGITLNHTKFNESLIDIILRISSPSDMLVQQITDSFQSTTDEIRDLLNHVEEILPNITPDALQFVKDQIKENVKLLNKDKRNELIAVLWKSITISSAKDIAKERGFDHRGSIKRIADEAIRWLSDGTKHVNAAKNEDSDRLYELSDRLAELFKTRENFEYLKEVFVANNIDKPTPARSASDYINYLFEFYDEVEDIFDVLSLNESNVKYISESIFENPPRLRKNELIAYMVDWVAYEV